MRRTSDHLAQRVRDIGFGERLLMGIRFGIFRMEDAPIADLEQLERQVANLRKAIASSGSTIAAACLGTDRYRLIAETSWCLDALNTFRAQLKAHAS